MQISPTTTAAAPVTVSVIGSSRYTLILQTSIVATAVAIFKMLLTRYTSFIGYVSLGEIGLVYTGLFFITGILFGQVTTDLKEAEKMPGEIVASLEQLEEFFKILMGVTGGSEADMLKANAIILKLGAQWKLSLKDGNAAMAADVYTTLTKIVSFAMDTDKKAGAAVINIVNVVDKIRRLVQRGSTLMRTNIIPSAHGLVQFFVLASTVILFFVKYTNEQTQLMIMICIYTVTWFSVRMLSSFDDPFEDEVFLGMAPLLGTNRLIHLFPLDEYALRVLKRLKMEATVADAAEVEKLSQELQASIRDEDYITVASAVVNQRVNGSATTTGDNMLPPVKQ